VPPGVVPPGIVPTVAFCPSAASAIASFTAAAAGTWVVAERSAAGSSTAPAFGSGVSAVACDGVFAGGVLAGAGSATSTLRSTVAGTATCVHAP
jgi:hypothetical protein